MPVFRLFCIKFLFFIPILSVVIFFTFSLGHLQKAEGANSSIYYGVHTPPWYPDFSGIPPLESLTGKQVSIVMGYTQWNRTDGVQNFNSSWFNQIRAHGSIPMLTWEPWISLQTIYNGSYDAYITKWAQDSKTWGFPYFLRFAHEMNGNWYPWSEQLNNSQSGDYIKAWKHVHDVFTANGVTNATWVWCPNVEGAGNTPIQQLYPGDNYVDWTCMDGYNFGGTSFFNVFNQTYSHILQIAPSKPIMIGETNSIEDGNKPNWVTDALTVQLPQNFPNIKAVVWYNNNFNGRTDWIINSSQNSLNAFKTGIAGSYFASNVFGNIISSPIAPISGPLIPTPIPVISVISTLAPSLTPATTFLQALGISNFIASIDTMKESRDTQTRPMSTAAIANDVNLSASLNTTHITVDTNWDYTNYIKLWVDAVHASGKHVWFRGHPNQWENDNGAVGIMTPTAYENYIKNFILTNSQLFKPGDIFDTCSEPEQGHYWIAQYGVGWSGRKASADEYNNFIVNSIDIANQAFQQVGITGVITTIHSTNSYIGSHPSVLYPSTVAKMGLVTIDSYPDQNITDPQLAANAWSAVVNSVWNAYHVPVIIGEFGYSNAINVDDLNQQKVISAELNALKTLPFLFGLNYWVGAGTQNSGGFTHIFLGNTGSWSLRPAAYDLSNFFLVKSMPASSTPSPTSVSSTPQLTQTSNNTVFLLTLCPHGIGNCGDNVSSGSGGTRTPLHTIRNIALSVSDINNNMLVSTISSQVVYNTLSQNFQGTVSIPNLSNRQYLINIKMDGYLAKQIPYTVTTQTQQITLPEVFLTAGDINNDNQLDIIDYHILISCYGNKVNTNSCPLQYKPSLTSFGADILDDDKQIDGGDFNLFLRELLGS